MTSKFFACVLLNCPISAVSKDTLPESQCRFRLGCSTINMVSTARGVQEKCIKQNMNFYAIFIDLRKAFDAVNREAF